MTKISPALQDKLNAASSAAANGSSSGQARYWNGLQERGLAPATINQRLAAVRGLSPSTR